MACSNRCNKYLTNYCLEHCPSRQKDKSKRDEELVAEWIAGLPCRGCPIEDMCKYMNSVKRIDFNPEIFDIPIICKRKASISVGIPNQTAPMKTNPYA